MGVARLESRCFWRIRIYRPVPGEEAGAAGGRVRIICREPERALHLKTLGDVGQIAIARLPAMTIEGARAACSGATHVVNLVGILHERRSGDFAIVHGDLAGYIAQAAKECGARSMVHISAIGASTSSQSAYAKSKAQGEQGVLSAFPDAAVIRPSIVFGPGDGFFERFGDMAARAPFLPLVDGGKTKFQPVYVGDVAAAIAACLKGESGTFELGGPNVYTFKQLLEYLRGILGRNIPLLPLPAGLLKLPAAIMEKFPNPQLTRDQLILLKYNNIVSPDARTLADLGISATPLEVIVPPYVRAYTTIQSRIKAPN